MGDSVLLITTIVLLVVVVVSGAVVAVGLRGRRRVFAGPARDAWQLARHDLSGRDQRHVQWATGRHRPVEHPSLALPQLVYSRYVQYQAEHSPLRRKSFRLAFAAVYVALAAQNFVNGAVNPHSRVFDFVLGTVFAALAVLWGLVMSRSLSRGPQRMKRLRQQVRERYPDW
jgi:hypothetical protein